MQRYDYTVIRTLSPVLLAAALLLFAAPSAPAQVAVDQGAIDSLKPTPPAAVPATKPKPPPHARTERKPASTAPKTTTAKPATGKPASTKPSTVKPPAAQAPVTLAPAPPPPVTMVTPALPPAHPVPGVPIPVSDDAKGTATKILGGVRVTFGPGSADLNPTTVAALRSLARTIGADPAASFNIYAYAQGTTDDPSTPRRLSLSRGLAARAVLMSEGIASTRIYVRALGAPALGAPPSSAPASGAPASGASPSDGTADRVDVTQVGIAPAPS